MVNDALEREADWRSVENPLHPGIVQSATYVDAVQASLRAMQMLEQFAEHSPWLSKRRTAFLKSRHEHPSPRPLPTLLDWIYVDDRWKQPAVEDRPAADIDALASDEAYLVVPAACIETERKPA